MYAGTTQGANVKAWIDMKDGLVIRVQISSPGAAVMTMVDVTKVSFVTPAASRFRTAGGVRWPVKPPPTAAQLIADETGDDPANYVNGMYGPGSKNSCSVVLRVVNAKTMTPITHIQVAIDTSYNVDNPPHYESGVHNDGTETFSGGGIHEITNMVHNGVVQPGNSAGLLHAGCQPDPAGPRERRGAGVSAVLCADHRAAGRGEGLRWADWRARTFCG